EATLESHRAATSEGHVVEIIFALIPHCESGYVSVGEITDAFIKRFGKEYVRPITARYIGQLIRTRLRLYTYKRHGNFVLPLATQQEHLALLGKRYGVDMGDIDAVGTLKQG